MMNIKNIWNNAWEALKVNAQGFGIKKSISALFSLTCVVLAFMYTNATNLDMTLGLFFGAIFSLLGVGAYEKKIDNKLEIEKATLEIEKK